MSLKISNLRSQPHFPGAYELNEIYGAVCYQLIHFSSDDYGNKFISSCYDHHIRNMNH